MPLAPLQVCVIRNQLETKAYARNNNDVKYVTEEGHLDI